MKFTRYLALAAAMVLGLFGAVFGCDLIQAPRPEMAAVKSSDSVSIPNIQAQPVQVNDLERTTMAMVSDKAWVKERVGVSPLNIYREPAAAVKTRDGYDDVLLKPKITEAVKSSYRGLGHDHFARADV